MERFHTIRTEANSLYIGDNKTLEEINNHKHSFATCCNLLKDFFYSTSFRIELIKKEYNSKKNEYKTIFKINSQKKQYEVEMNGDFCTIQSEDMKYTWKIWNEECELVEISKKKKDKTIVQNFLSHMIIIQVKIKNKTWKIKIPMDIYYVLDFDFLEKIIKETTKVEDLKKAYFEHFYRNQSNYDRTLETIISYYEEKNGADILLDELTIKDGKITSYQFSEWKENILLSNKNGVIEIHNYTLNTPLDLNSEVTNLLQRSKKQN